MISDIALTADNPLHCVLAGGQWTVGPDKTLVQCGESGSGPFTCSQSPDSTSITLYRRSRVPFSGNQLYTCSSGEQNISVQIESECMSSCTTASNHAWVLWWFVIVPMMSLFCGIITAV